MLYFILGLAVGIVLLFILTAVYLRENTLGELKDYSVMLRKNADLKRAISIRIPEIERRIAEIENNLEGE